MYDCVRCACANSRTRHTKTRLEATLPCRALEMQLQFSLHAGLFTSGGMLPSAKAHCICTSYTSVTYDMHMHICTRCTLYTCACRTAQNPCQKRASLMQHCMVATSRVDPIWPKLVFSATADCALHPYVSTTYGDRYHVHVSEVEFLRAAGENFGNWEVKRSSFSEKMAISGHGTQHW